ncbi:hypothetical protein AXF42_Ash002808 [Apostasia shenzhenica]|uniref:C2H2-type domain-containing protein n=1 Tax=Apostasia shenzhenica TaxID=1088818 RepID=A0A2I0A7C1_9ASPA|nr:hypothetical protein AXF42_Ash002808 [Apostasia shenzhenica]
MRATASSYPFADAGGGVVKPVRPPSFSLPSHFHRSCLPLHPTPCFLPPLSLCRSFPRPIAAISSRSLDSSADIEMIRDRDGSWSAREQKVIVLWDLDNKPPRGQPYSAAVSIRRVAESFGRVVEISAYANRHAFLHLPQWVVENRRERHRLDVVERKGFLVPDEPYVCGVCGRKCRTNLDLKRHFRQLHERERQKKLSRMRSLKGKKREKYKQRYISGNHKYTEAARQLLTPKTGYGLASELRRAGVFVKTVEDKPQAADAALKRQMRHSLSRGIDCLFLVSDDSDFSEMIRSAREADLRTVVIGDGRRALGRLADIWLPWMQVEQGEVGEEVLLNGDFTEGEEDEEDNGEFTEGEEDEEDNEAFYSSDLQYVEEDDDDDDRDCDDHYDHVVHEVVVESSGFDGVNISVFSEEEVWDVKKFRSRKDNSGVSEASITGTSLSWTVEDEEGEHD